MEIENMHLNWLGNSGFKIKTPNGKIIYIDPYNVKAGLESADFIFLTHSHYDHCSVEDIHKLIKPGTKIIMPVDCQSKIMKFDIPINYEIIEPGKEIDFIEFKVDTIPSYNIDKSFHPKTEDWVGYVFKIKNILIYHAGDTDNIPEMQKLTGYKQGDKKFIALLPIGGRFTMTPEEALESVKLIKPDLVIPMHYGSVAGTLEDAKEFKELCEENGIEARILDKE